MESLVKDLRYALRRLRKSPGFSAVVLLTLALGIGANTAIFSVVNTVLLRPFPFRNPDRLVTIDHYYPSLNNLEAGASAPGFRDLRDKGEIFDGVFVENGWAPALTGMGEARRLQGAHVSGQYFSTLGVSALRGRGLLPEEDAPGHNLEVVISWGLWQREFGGEASAVGRSIQLNNESYQIVGVMPPEFQDFFNPQAEIWTPLALAPDRFADNLRTNEYLSLIARLKPGVTIEQARTRMGAFATRLKQQYPGQYPPDWTLKTATLGEKKNGRIRPALLVLLGAVGFVLLIACANVANLLLARAAARMKEVAIRSALGATRRALVRQLLVESVMLAVLGGALGVGLAWAGVRGVVALRPANIPRVDQLAIDPLVLGFAVLVSLVTGVLFGLVPVIQMSRPNLQDTLKEGGRSSAADRSGHRLRQSLVVAEMALALTLLTGAGLLVKSFARVSSVDPGFDPARLLTFNVTLPNAKYRTDTARVVFWSEAVPRLAALPGVQGVAVTSVMPFGGQWSTGSFSVEGYQPAKGQPGPWGDIRIVSTDFHKVMHVPLLKGRAFDATDDGNAPTRVVVDEEAAKRFWPGKDPIGRRITFGNPEGKDSTQWITVIGVVGHTKHEGLDAENRVQLYFDLPQAAKFGAAGNFMAVAVRTSGNPTAMLPAVRHAVHDIDSDIPISGASTMDELIANSMGQRRFSMLLLALFSTLALALAAIGIYGLMSFMVTQRSHEMGVRMTLGASRRDVLSLVMRSGMTLVVVGTGIGVAGAVALRSVIASQLFGVSATDPSTFVVVAVTLVAVAAVATLVPALRATRVDPAVALREE